MISIVTVMTKMSSQMESAVDAQVEDDYIATFPETVYVICFFIATYRILHIIDGIANIRLKED